MQYLFLSLLVGYLLGSVSTALAVSKLMFREDIREKGSGNAGLTNTLRVYGKKAALFVLLGDVLKAVIAALIAMAIGNMISAPGFGGTVLGGQQYMDWHLMIRSHGTDPLVLAACLGAVIGHNWPLYFGFKGGKGVLVSATALFFVDWKMALACLAVFAIVVAISKYVSLGSMCGAVACLIYVGIAIACGWPGGTWWHFGYAAILVVMIILGHTANIRRLASGTEKKLSFHKSGE